MVFLKDSGKEYQAISFPAWSSQFVRARSASVQEGLNLGPFDPDPGGAAEDDGRDPGSMRLSPARDSKYWASQDLHGLTLLNRESHFPGADIADYIHHPDQQRVFAAR